jgi:DNA processing protein
VESAQDILEDLHIQLPPPDAQSAGLASDPAPALHTGLLGALGFDPMGLDALQARTGLDTPTLQAQLLELELAGHVARLPGGLLQRMGRG